MTNAKPCSRPPWDSYSYSKVDRRSSFIHWFIHFTWNIYAIMKKRDNNKHTHTHTVNWGYIVCENENDCYIPESVDSEKWGSLLGIVVNRTQTRKMDTFELLPLDWQTDKKKRAVPKGSKIEGVGPNNSRVVYWKGKQATTGERHETQFKRW